MPKIKMHVLLRVPHLQLEDLDSLAAPLSIEAAAADIESAAKAGSRVATELETSWITDGIFPSIEVWGFLF